MGCLAGCTSNDQTVENEKNTSETEQAESGEKTVITVARWGTDSEKEAFIEAMTGEGQEILDAMYQ